MTIEEIEQVLNRIVSRSPFSSSSLKDEIRQTKSELVIRFNEFATIFRRLYSSSTKWMIRIMFKDLSSLELSKRFILQRFHFLLSDLLQFQNSFHACITVLEIDIIKKMSIKSTERDENFLRKSTSCYLKSQFDNIINLFCRNKVRSIVHCCQLTRERTMNVEQKYDDEYCQIHVRLTGSSFKI